MQPGSPGFSKARTGVNSAKTGTPCQNRIIEISVTFAKSATPDIFAILRTWRSILNLSRSSHHFTKSYAIIVYDAHEMAGRRETEGARCDL
jgi:hypothetical protein